MKFVYCSECGMALEIYRKSMGPKYGRILDIVKPHECLPEPAVKFNPNPTPSFITLTEGKFVKKINELVPLPGSFPTEPGDRRPTEHVRTEAKSSAPSALLSHLSREIGKTEPIPTPEGSEEDSEV